MAVDLGLGVGSGEGWGGCSVDGEGFHGVLRVAFIYWFFCFAWLVVIGGGEGRFCVICRAFDYVDNDKLGICFADSIARDISDQNYLLFNGLSWLNLSCSSDINEGQFKLIQIPFYEVSYVRISLASTMTLMNPNDEAN